MDFVFLYIVEDPVQGGIALHSAVTCPAEHAPQVRDRPSEPVLGGSVRLLEQAPKRRMIGRVAHGLPTLRWVFVSDYPLLPLRVHPAVHNVVNKTPLILGDVHEYLMSSEHLGTRFEVEAFGRQRIERKQEVGAVLRVPIRVERADRSRVI